MKSHKKGLLFLLIVLLCCSILSGCKTRYFPESGTWYCEELQLYLRFGYNRSSTVVVDEEEIGCSAGFMEGSKEITVLVEDFDAENLQWYDLVFPGIFVSRNESELVLGNRDTKELFVFIRIGE